VDLVRAAPTARIHELQAKDMELWTSFESADWAVRHLPGSQIASVRQAFDEEELDGEELCVMSRKRLVKILRRSPVLGLEAADVEALASDLLQQRDALMAQQPAADDLAPTPLPPAPLQPSLTLPLQPTSSSLRSVLRILVQSSVQFS
jgi:hypothetical protein